jgi:hypothetical protein
MSFASSCIAFSEPLLCFYINRTHETQIARFTRGSKQSHDRLVRPNEHLLFEALPGEMLEIYVLTVDRTMLLRTLDCRDLTVSTELIENMLRWLS